MSEGKCMKILIRSRFRLFARPFAPWIPKGPQTNSEWGFSLRATSNSRIFFSQAFLFSVFVFSFKKFYQGQGGGQAIEDAFVISQERTPMITAGPGSQLFRNSGRSLPRSGRSPGGSAATGGSGLNVLDVPIVF